jgi:predicted RNA polymerase sigma factor
VSTDTPVEDLLRELAPQVLGALIRRCGRFDACEDAVQEALLAAAVQWPQDGVPDSPRAWLVTVAGRRLTDQLRSELARRRREATAAALVPPDETVAAAPGDPQPADRDDTLTLLFLCCHMLLTDARRPARTGPDGSLVPLAEQDRGKWDQPSIREGVTLITRTLATPPVGPYQLQAAIAAVHAEATRAEDTDWPQILALHELLSRVSPNPMVTLNQAVAVAMVRGPRAGLDLLEPLDADDRMTGHHRLDAVRAHLLEMAGDRAAARSSYRIAARRTTSLPEQRYLEARAARLAPAPAKVRHSC